MIYQQAMSPADRNKGIQTNVRIPGYRLTEVIHEGIKTIIYRGIFLANKEPVILKVLKEEYPSLDAIARLKHEYHIMQNLNHAGVAKVYRLLNINNRLGVVSEDFGGVSLKQLLSAEKLSIASFLEISVQIVVILAYIHNQQIIHKDIKPANIINLESGIVKLIDFSIASRSPKESPSVLNPNQLEGTLAYTSPEQTGRINRIVDYRSDFYSLGVTFYEMLTGSLPFLSHDPLELLHCHIAKLPIEIEKLNPEVPLPIAQIVMKLMAKDAEERYQSALGLLVDLESCLLEMKNSGKVTNFTLGLRDVSGLLIIPQKLYGREEEVKNLLKAFERTSIGRSELILVSGYSGVGKSSLVKEIHKSIVQQGGYFITGKFDQLQCATPYGAIIQALKSLIRQLFTEDAEKLQQWRQKILTVVGYNGQLIIDVIPEVELIIGKQQPVTEIGLMESENRFNLVISEFLSIFTQKEHPLVIFLDDLQWADATSLKLMQLLISDSSSKYLLLIAAYRDNEVDENHPLMKILPEIENTGIVIQKICLQHLQLSSIEKMLCETMKTNATQQINELASLLFHQTTGNPFFLTQMLHTLYQEGLLQFEFALGNWKWNLKDIQMLVIPDLGVVELIARNIEKLPNATKSALKLAACIGNNFTLDILAIISEKSIHEVAQDLSLALQQGLILPCKRFRDECLVIEKQELQDYCLINSTLEYNFLHDRMQQAAYSLIPENEKQATHVKIGQLLLKNTPESEIEAKIFEIVNQLNFGIESFQSQLQKDELAKLNFIAGRKAKAANAYEIAFNYLKICISLSKNYSWINNYNFLLKLHIEATEAAYLCGKLEKVEELSNSVLKNGNNILDKIKIFEIKILVLIAESKSDAAIELGLQVLNKLRINLPKKPSYLYILMHFIKINIALGRKGDERLMNLPSMTDSYSLAAIKIISAISTAAVFTNPNLLVSMIFVQVELSIKKGNAPISAIAYASYATLLSGIFNQVEAGYKLGEVTLSLLSRFQDNTIKAKLLNILAVYTFSWKTHWRENLSLFQLAISSGMETGDLEYVAWSYVSEIYLLFLLGEDLENLNKKLNNTVSIVRKLKHKLALNTHNLIWQTVLNLRGLSDNPYHLIGQAYHEELKQKSEDSINFSCIFNPCYFLLQICYLFGEYSIALENANKSAKNLDIIISHPAGRVLFFYDSLTRLAIYELLSESEKKQALKKIQANQKKLRIWSKNAPSNFQHKYNLVEAEYHRVLGKTYQAMEYYDLAIKGAAENGYIQEQGIANERAAEFYFYSGRENIAKTYITEAYYCYTCWGALAKVKELEARYPFLDNSTKQKLSPDVSISTNSTSITNTLSLDLSTVIKASQALSSEIILARLLDKLLHIVKENAGAQKVFFITKNANKFIIESSLRSDEEDITTLQPLPIQESHMLPVSLINYVERTCEYLVLDDVSEAIEFNYDPYIIANKPLSVLVLPIIQTGYLTGFLYLENNLTKGAFSCERIEVLQVLASQAAISLENARFYKTLEIRVAERTKELETTLEELRRTQQQLIQTEKMSSLGQLVGGIAHEINNPASFIYGNLTYAEKYAKSLLELVNTYQEIYPNPKPEVLKKMSEIELDFIREDLDSIYDSMESGVERIQTIVESLKTFSRLDESAIKKVDIHEGIESTLMILQHKLNKIQVIKHYGNLPKIKCYASQLNQVFMSLLTNAIDALHEGINNQQLSSLHQTIWIRTELVKQDVVSITIADNGVGISPDVLNKIFDPFFTTKPVGKGTGLGLSVSYQIIVEMHRGELLCHSTLGEGTEFTILLPC